MCGIAGQVSFDRHMVEENLVKALDALSHRGPDASGTHTWQTGKIFAQVGMTRLAVMDTSAAANQPFFSLNRRQLLIYNGEIYNFIELREDMKRIGMKFTTNSDTEVLIQGITNHGIDFLTQCEGMFAFFYVNFDTGEVLLARDAFGMKPCFYTYRGKRFSFASEIMALTKLIPGEKLDLDFAASALYLDLGRYDENEATFISGVHSLKPGHAIKFNFNDSNISTEQIAWFNPIVIPNNDITFEEASNKVKELVLKNLETHVRADRSLGISISGGVDSSIIAFGLRELFPQKLLNTFGYDAKGLPYSERKWIELVSAKLNSAHVMIEHDEIESLEELRDMIQFQGMPFGSLSIFAQWKVFQAYKNKDVVVSIDGQGADEIFGGYSGYPKHRVHELLQSHQYIKLGKFIKGWKNYPQRELKMIAASLIEYRNRIAPIDSVQPFHSNHLLSVASQNAVRSQNLPALLRHGDRNSMRWGVESRQPYLTPKLVEFCWSLPSKYHVSDTGLTKNVLRHAFIKIVPDEILYRKDKIGFQAPWLSETTTKFLLQDSQTLLEEIGHIFLFNRTYMSSPKAPKFVQWRFINFMQWLKIYGIKL